MRRIIHTRAVAVWLVTGAGVIAFHASTLTGVWADDAEATTLLQTGLESLQSPKAAVRTSAVGMLLQGFDEARSPELVNTAILGLVQSMRDRDKGVRAFASKSLAAVIDGLAQGPMLQTVVARMAALMNNTRESAAVRGNAALGVGYFLAALDEPKLCEQVAALLVQGLRDPNPTFRRHVVDALIAGVEGMDDEDTQDALVLQLTKSLTDRAPTVRQGVAETLSYAAGVIDEDDTLKSLAVAVTPSLQDVREAADVRKFAARALGHAGHRLPDRQDAAAIAQVLKGAAADKDAGVRSYVAGALRLLSTPEE